MNAPKLNRALLKACEEQHRAIDWLLTQVIRLDPTFFPSESPAWPAVVQGYAAIKAARSAIVSEAADRVGS